MEEKQTNEIVVNLKDLWDIFVNKILIIALVALLAVAGLGVYKTATYAPQYESVATLYILAQDSSTTAAFNVALAVINDCRESLTSYAVLDTVINTLGLNMSTSMLRSMISTTNPDSTRFIYVTVRSSSPQMSKEIVDLLCRTCADKMENAMNGLRQVNVYAEGKISNTPCNKTGLMTYLLVGAAGAVLTYGVFVIMSLIDDRFRDDEDIKRTLGVTILGDIPNANADVKNGAKYGKGSYGKKYGRSPGNATGSKIGKEN